MLISVLRVFNTTAVVLPSSVQAPHLTFFPWPHKQPVPELTWLVPYLRTSASIAPSSRQHSPLSPPHLLGRVQHDVINSRKLEGKTAFL